MSESKYDAVVIGSGPAGHNAAVTAAGLGAKTLIIERETNLGGACVQYGTIPSKTLRETAVALSTFGRRSGNVYQISPSENLRMESLMVRLQQVVAKYQTTRRRHLQFSGVDTIHGQAAFESSHHISIRKPNGETCRIEADWIFIAAGSRPRTPPEIPVDHENIFDSDSILSMTYLPKSLLVLGGGVIASEYASVFSRLGVHVIMVDRYPTPLGFLDADLVEVFMEQFRQAGSGLLPNQEVVSMEWDGVSQVVTKLRSGDTIRTDKALVAQGRVANTRALELENVGLRPSEQGLIEVNGFYQTDVEHIFAVGDAIGPPSLASTSLHQGRSAANFAFAGRQMPSDSNIPIGIYTIPEIASVGISEQQAEKTETPIRVARVEFTDVARGEIMASQGGFLKLLADQSGRSLLGVQVIGDGATELIHIGQLALSASMSIDQLAVANFNFPTLAELYRFAALEIIDQRQRDAERLESADTIPLPLPLPT